MTFSFSRWLAFVAFPTALAAAPLNLSRDDAVRHALAANPDLLAARAIIAEAEARASGAGRRPNPELETELAAGNRFDGRIEIGLTQRLPLTARLRLERTHAAIAIDLARLEVAAREERVAADVRAAFVAVLAADAAVALAENQAALANELAATLRAQADAGQGSSLDAGQAQLTARAAGTALATRQLEARLARAELGALLGAEAAQKFTLNGSLDLPAAPAVAADPAEPDVSARADLRLAERATAAGDVAVELARASRREDVGVGVFVESERTRDEPAGPRRTETLLGVRLSVPLPVRQAGVAAIRESQATRQRLARELDALRQRARHEARVAVEEVRARHAAALAAAELVPAAARQLAETEAAHARGEAEGSAVFLARERLADFERDALAARHAYHLAHLRQLAALGSAPSATP